MRKDEFCHEFLFKKNVDVYFKDGSSKTYLNIIWVVVNDNWLLIRDSDQKEFVLNMELMTGYIIWE